MRHLMLRIKAPTVLLMLLLLNIGGVNRVKAAPTSFGTGSSWEVVGTTMTITIGNGGDFSDYISDWSAGNYGTTLCTAIGTTVTKVVVKTINSAQMTSADAAAFYFAGNAGCVTTIDFSEAEFESGALNSLNTNQNNGKIYNLIVPDAYKSDPASAITGTSYNLFGIDGDEIIAVINNAEKLAWSDVIGTCTTLVINQDITSALDLSTSGFTNFVFNGTLSANVTLPDGSTAKIQDNSQNGYIQGTNITIDVPTEKTGTFGTGNSEYLLSKDGKTLTLTINAAGDLGSIDTETLNLIKSAETINISGTLNSSDIGKLSDFTNAITISLVGTTITGNATLTNSTVQKLDVTGVTISDSGKLTLNVGTEGNPVKLIGDAGIVDGNYYEIYVGEYFGENGSYFTIGTSKEVVIFHIAQAGDFGALVNTDTNGLFSSWDSATLTPEQISIFRDHAKIIRFVADELNEDDVQKLIGFVSTSTADFKRTFDFTDVGKLLSYKMNLPRGEYNSDDNKYRGCVVISRSDIYPKTIYDKIMVATSYGVSYLAATANYYNCSDETPGVKNTYEIYIPKGKKPVTMFEYNGLNDVNIGANEIPDLAITNVVVFGDGDIKDWIESLDKDLVKYNRSNVTFFDAREAHINGDLTLANPYLKEVDFTGISATADGCVNKVDLTGCTNLEVARFVDAKIKTIDASGLAKLEVLNLTGVHTGETTVDGKTKHTFEELSVDVTNSGTATISTFDNPTVETGKTRVDGMQVSPEFTEYTEDDLIKPDKITGDYSAGYCKGRPYVMDKNTLDITLRIKSALTWGKYGQITSLRQFTRSIKKEIAHLYADKEQIGEDADISADHVNFNTVKIIGPLRPRNMAAFNDYSEDLDIVGKYEQGDIVCKFLDLTEAFPVENAAPATVVSEDTGYAITWGDLFEGVDTKYIDYVIMPTTTSPDFITAGNFANFTALKAAGVMSSVGDEAHKYAMTAYVKTPGSLNSLAGYMSYHILGNAGSRVLCNLPDHSTYYAHYKYDAILVNNDDKVQNVTLRGSLNALDVCNSNVGTCKLTDGHLTLDGDGEMLGDVVHGGLHASDIKVLDLSGAVFEEVKDFTLSKLGTIGAGCEQIWLPASPEMTELPEDFLNVANGNIKEICIPYNIRVIGRRAFAGLTSLYHIYTTDAEGTIIDKAGIYSGTYTDKVQNVTKSGEKSIVGGSAVDGVYTFSANLGMIGTGAFASPGVGDVYVLATTAPICEVDAFNSATYCSNNAYTRPEEGTGITRSDYNSNGGMAVLHYPAEATVENKKKYTDITREYSITDRDGRLDGNGKTIMWPNQQEFNRAYAQGRTGYLWKAWDTTRDTNYSFLTNAGYSTGKTVAEAQVNADDVYDTNTYATKINEIFYDIDNVDAEGAAITEGNNSNLFDEDYRGWHQFVLTEAAGDGPQKFAFDWIVDNNWWTICIPFDMTLGDLRTVFGHTDDDKEYFPIVSQLTKVIRSKNGGTMKEEGTEFKLGENTVLLYFCDDLVKKAMTRKDIQVPCYDGSGSIIRENGDVQTETTDDESKRNSQIVIQAGQPYLIKPYMRMDGNTPAETAFMEMNENLDSSVFDFETRKKNLYFGQRDVRAIDLDGDKQTDSNEYTYTFSGCYSGWYYPTYSFYLGVSSSTPSGVAIKRLTSTPKVSGNRSWRSYSSVILVNWGVTGGATLNEESLDTRETKRTVKTDAFTAGGTTHWVMWTGTNGASSVSTDDRFSTGQQTAKNNIVVSFGDFSEDSNNPAKIDGVEISPDSNITVITRQKVYNLNGQLVSNDGSLKDLPRGCYILNGKKYVVK